MKNIGCCFLLLFLLQAGFSQVSWETSLQVATTTRAYSLSPGVAVTGDRFHAGLRVFLGRDHIEKDFTPGAQIDYAFYPNGKLQTLNFFFTTNFIYHYQSLTRPTFSTETNNYQLTIGYGFDWHFSSTIYLRQYFGLGATLQQRFFEGPRFEEPLFFDAGGILALSLCYQFGNDED